VGSIGKTEWSFNYEVKVAARYRHKGEIWDCALPGTPENFQVTDRFRESGFPGTRDPAGHQNNGCVICCRGNQLCKDLRRNALHGKGEGGLFVTVIFDAEIRLKWWRCTGPGRAGGENRSNTSTSIHARRQYSVVFNFLPTRSEIHLLTLPQPRRPAITPKRSFSISSFGNIWNGDFCASSPGSVERRFSPTTIHRNLPRSSACFPPLGRRKFQEPATFPRAPRREVGLAHHDLREIPLPFVRRFSFIQRPGLSWQ
jgi:hypothetical protein